MRLPQFRQSHSQYQVFSQDESIEAILLEDSPTAGVVENCSSTKNIIIPPINNAIRDPHSASKLMDVSNQSNLPFMPSKMDVPKNARSKYEQLRSVQQFSSSSSKKKEEKQVVTTSASREVALAWMEMGETYSKPNNLHSFSQFQAPRSLSVCSSSSQLQQQPQKNIVKNIISWRLSSSSDQHGGERTQDGHDTRTVPESRDISHMENLGDSINSFPFFQCDPTSLRSIEKAHHGTSTRSSTSTSRTYYDRSKTEFDTGRIIDQDQSTNLDRRNHSKRQEAREQPQRGSSRHKQKQQSSRSKMSKSDASHWKSALDPKSGRTYFYHELTRETQWRQPTELASDSERRDMEEKERKQKDFFAAMEANILNSMSEGVIPGTPKGPQLERKKSAEKPAPSRPELVRTISAMDDTLLSDLIRRQPSYRNISLQKAPSLNAADLVCIQKNRTDEGEGFETIRPYTHFLDPLNESTGSGFGLTFEETQALRKLADITKEMIDVEKEEYMTSPNALPGGGKFRVGDGGGTPGWKPSKDIKGGRELPRELDFSDDEGWKPSKDIKGGRELPRELDFSDDESESDLTGNEANNNNSMAHIESASKPARMLPRELEFSDDSDSETSDLGKSPEPVRQKSVRIKEEKREKPKKEALIERPKVTRRNTCGTIYVGTTMSAPDKDATIKCVCGVFRAHILSSAQPQNADESDGFLVFNDLESQRDRFEKKTTISLPKYRIPSLDEVTSFYRDVFFKAQMETDCIIMSLIYVEGLIKRTNGDLRPRASNWRSLLFSCMILSSKVWDDLSMWNVDFSQSCPPGVSFPLKRVNQLELAVLNALTFQVKVPASEYAKYYFLLRSMLIKSGLGGDDMNTLDPLDVLGARKLQHVSAQFESVSRRKSKVQRELTNRSKSLTAVDQSRIAAKQNGAPNKVGLEYLVKM